MEKRENLIFEKRKDYLAQTGSAISRMTGKLVYIFDTHRKKIVYSSFNRGLHGGHDLTYMKDHWQETFLSDTPKAERELFRQVFQSIPSVAESRSLGQAQDTVLHVFLHTKSQTGMILTHHRITPIDVKKGVFLGIGEQVHDTDTSKAILTIPGKSYYLKYNPGDGGWGKSILPTFAANEKETLRLSSQGLSIKEIATILGKNENTVKGYRRRVMKALEQKNITGAIHMALIFGII